MANYANNEAIAIQTTGRREVYPRPDFDRSHRWLSLNGNWDFIADPGRQGQVECWEQPGKARWAKHIQVPFAWETPASGIGLEWLPVGWYRRILQRPEAWAHERIILHFGAVHYRCQVWINGLWIGEHCGGYLPFSFDVTDALQNGQGELIVCVEAPLDKLAIPHGKQRSQPDDDYHDCQFTACSGIWQSVWLEGHPETFIQQVRLSSAPALDALEVRVEMKGEHLAEAKLSVQVEEMPAQAISVQGATTLTCTLPISQPRPWTPHDPYLYHVTLRLESPDGTDQVKSYTGLRTVEVQGNRLLLNGERLYLRGALDQGYWPESGYTAPNDEALRHDVELALKVGFNLIRKHIKFEDPLWLYWADQLGLLVWAEPPCFGRFSEEAAARFEAQLPLMVERDYNHPAIILWGIYNEEWGLDWRSAEDVEKQEAVIRAYDLLAASDHSRPIIDDSGWNHVKTDVLDWHYYDEDNRRWSEVTAAIASDEKTWFGHQLGVDHWYETQLSIAYTNSGHSELPLMNGEYGAGRTAMERGWYFRWQTQELRRHDAIMGYIYTELYDVEHELCGLYDAQRQLKALGYDPAQIVNAETVIIFDLVPYAPGTDYIAEQASIVIPLRLSHQGPQSLHGRLSWYWESDDAQEQSMPLDSEPYTITAPLSLHLTLPSAQAQGRMHVQFLDEHEQRLAYAFLDIARAEMNEDRLANKDDLALS